jgi:hypothetical protein
MPFSRDDAQFAFRARMIMRGRGRARYWRSLGFPNLARARAVYRRMREERRLAEEAIATTGNADSESDAPKKKRKKKQE